MTTASQPVSQPVSPDLVDLAVRHVLRQKQARRHRRRHRLHTQAHASAKPPPPLQAHAPWATPGSCSSAPAPPRTGPPACTEATAANTNTHDQQPANQATCNTPQHQRQLHLGQLHQHLEARLQINHSHSQRPIRQASGSGRRQRASPSSPTSENVANLIELHQPQPANQPSNQPASQSASSRASSHTLGSVGQGSAPHLSTGSGSSRNHTQIADNSWWSSRLSKLPCS